MVAIPALSHAAILDSYIGFSGAKIDYYQKDKSGGNVDSETWDLAAFELHNGTRLSKWIIFETRFGSSQKETDTLLGTEETAVVKRYYGTLLKIRPDSYDFSPYLLGGTTTGAIETCAAVCQEGFWSELSYGFGLDYRVFTGSSIYLEYFKIAQSKQDFPKESLTSLNVGINVTSNEFATFGK